MRKLAISMPRIPHITVLNAARISDMYFAEDRLVRLLHLEAFLRRLPSAGSRTCEVALRFPRYHQLRRALHPWLGRACRIHESIVWVLCCHNTACA
jgi:hypothetical protein